MRLDGQTAVNGNLACKEHALVLVGPKACFGNTTQTLLLQDLLVFRLPQTSMQVV